MAIYVVWIRNDLRFHDNRALIHAVDHVHNSDRVLLFFHLDPNLFKISCKSHQYFFSALSTFYNRCLQQDKDIYFAYGDVLTCMDKLLKSFDDIERIYFNIDESGYGEIRDHAVRHFLKEREVAVFDYHDHHLHSAREILINDDGPYKVFTPYFNQWRDRLKGQEYCLDEEKFQKVVLGALKKRDPMGTEKFKEVIRGISKDYFEDLGEDCARKILDDAIHLKLENYDRFRDYPYIDGTSKLSAFLSTGQISIRTVYNAVDKSPDSEGKASFIRQLAWRDFYNMIYHFNPNQENVEIISKYRNLAWSYQEETFKKWKEGKTGFPIVDAAMRQLINEGWMHNRLRMIVASFLVKDLLMDWRLGERYFSQMLIDYDPASNIGGWQWAASVGTDAAPYFRIFNPSSQSKKFDPKGRYIKRYIEELGQVPEDYIHEPFKYHKLLKSQYGIDIEDKYLKPIVDHKIQRIRAIQMFKDTQRGDLYES